MLKILRLSSSVTSSTSTTAFFRRLADSLDRHAKAVVKLNLLRLTRVVCDNLPERATFVSTFDLARIVDRLGKQDDAILVREMAKEIYPSLLFGSEQPVGPMGVVGAIPSSVLSTVKRTTSESVFADVRDEKTLVGERKGKVAVGPGTPVKVEEKPKHKRKISRSQLR